MTDSITDSGHDTNSTIDTGATDTTGTSVTLGKIPNHKQFGGDQLDVLPKLPSHKFRYSVWHDLRETCLTGDQLHAPRVRAGPPEKDKQFHQIIEDGLPIHHHLSGKQRQVYTSQFENWEQAKVINLCYQELQHEYQRTNFIRILSRCQSAELINVSHNNIISLGSLTFPSCIHFNANFNYIKFITRLPSLPKVKTITATNNAIESLDGLKKYRGCSHLEELYLSGNPVTFYPNYRQRVFTVLPQLKVLDGIPRLPADTEIVEPEDSGGSSCTIL